MNLRRYLLRKAAYVVLTVFFIASLNFLLFQVVPGDPTRVLIPRGGSSNVTGDPGLRAQLIHDWGLDQPVMTRFVIYFENLLKGNLGTSLTYRPGFPVLDVILPRLTSTLIMVGIATALTGWVGVILGRISGWRRGRPSDLAITLGGLIGYSMPTFWISLLLIFMFSVALNWFPVQGAVTLGLEQADLLTQLVDRADHLVLPIATFVLTNFAIFSLTLRNSLTDVLTEDYMLTARAKGLPTEMQLRRHAMPNARLPVVTVGAFYFGWVVSGAILIEIIFRLPGIGLLQWDAVLAHDTPLVSAVFLVATLGVVLANAIADVLYVVLDPRIREA